MTWKTPKLNTHMKSHHFNFLIVICSKNIFSHSILVQVPKKKLQNCLEKVLVFALVSIVLLLFLVGRAGTDTEHEEKF